MRRITGNLLAVSALSLSGLLTACTADAGDTADDTASDSETPTSEGAASEDAASATPSAAEVMTVSGYLDLISGSIYEDDEGVTCWGAEGYDDLAAGGQVTVYNSTDEAIALGALDTGQVVVTKGMMTADPCRFPFTIEDVPADGSIFAIEVTHRGQVNFEKSEAANIRLTLED